jgi:hypothetical protein
MCQSTRRELKFVAAAREAMRVVERRNCGSRGWDLL